MADYVSLTERRTTLRLLAYWEKLRGSRAMPGEQDIKSEDINDLWDHCFLLPVGHLAAPQGHYTYMGDAIRELYQCPSGPARHYARLADTSRPVLDEGEFKDREGHTVKYRQCLLPLGAGDKAEVIFGAIRFKLFHN